MTDILARIQGPTVTGSSAQVFVRVPTQADGRHLWRASSDGAFAVVSA